MKSQPLSDAELDRLSDVLKRFGDKRAMTLEQMDGFLSALICCPNLVPPSEYLPEIWGGDMVLEDEFSAKPNLEDFLSLVMRHWNSIVEILNSGEVYLPLLLQDEDGNWHGNEWADGFLRGMDLRRESWADLIDDEEHGGSLVPIFALAHENSPDPEMRTYQEPVSEELRAELIVGAAAGMNKIYHYFEAQRLLGIDLPENITSFRRSVPKIGRNDPCPCGSGKKFKHCCAKTTLH
jgi:uncharacterized protein